MEPVQTSNQEEFKELCLAVQGRWVTTWDLPMDSPGVGSKGEKVTAYQEARLTADGSAFLGTAYIGDNVITSLCTYDPVAQQIKFLEVVSGGSVWNSRFFKKDGLWRREGTGNYPDGTKAEISGTITFSDDGDTHTHSGTGTAESGETSSFTLTWRRVGR